jgi:carboxypeptidase Taq
MSNLDELKTKVGETVDLGHSRALLEWDAQVNMARGGAEERGNLIGTLVGIMVEKIKSDKTARTLEGAEKEVAGLEDDNDDVRIVRSARREYDRLTKVPGDWMANFARLTTVAQNAWEVAKEKSDFAHFKPHLSEIVNKRREYAGFFAPFDHVYDPLLDEFDPGMKTVDVKNIFAKLRPEQVAVVKEIASRPQVDNSFLVKDYEAQKQWDFGVDVITHFGYDWNRGRQDKSVHPFTTSFGLDDVRFTTKIEKNWPAAAMFGSMHECGHALFDQGISPKFRRTTVKSNISMAVHESQSRMMENMVGRSLPFWKYFYPKLQSLFPENLANVSLEQFYRGVNKVEPSLIRIEADEATYNLHIMLRLELEIALMEGSQDVETLPEAWNAKVQEYLGITPPNDAEGVLQDVHWSNGYFGYFPTYALGNLLSAMWWEKIEKDIPDLHNQFEHGKFDGLLTWLRTNIHQYGGKYTSQELSQRIAGGPIDPTPYVRYLRTKFGAIYGF